MHPIALLEVFELPLLSILVPRFAFYSSSNCRFISPQAIRLKRDDSECVFCYLFGFVILEAGLSWVRSLLLAVLDVWVLKFSIFCCYSIISIGLNLFFQVYHFLITFQLQAYRTSNPGVCCLNQMIHISFILSHAF